MAEAATARQLDTLASEPHANWSRVQALTCQLTVDLAMPGVRVRDLIDIKKNMVINSHWQLSTDVPVRVNGELIAWSEFEVVGKQLAVRVTELA